MGVSLIATELGTFAYLHSMVGEEDCTAGGSQAVDVLAKSGNASSCILKVEQDLLRASHRMVAPNCVALGHD